MAAVIPSDERPADRAFRDCRLWRDDPRATTKAGLRQRSRASPSMAPSRLYGPRRRGDPFRCDSEATRSTHEIAGFVPDRERRCSARRSDRRAGAKVSRRRRDGWSSPQALDRARSPVLLLVPQLRQCRSSARFLQVTTDRAVSQHDARPNETPLPLADRPGDGKRARRLTVAITAERHSRRRRTGRFPDSSDAITSSADGRGVGTPGGAALSASRAIGALPIAHRRERVAEMLPSANAVAKREPAARAPGPYYAESVSTSAAFIRRTRTPG